jgi:hypothetical protein
LLIVEEANAFAVVTALTGLGDDRNSSGNLGLAGCKATTAAAWLNPS